MFLDTEPNIIKSLFDLKTENKAEIYELIMFVLTWYCLTILTYGVWVPAGLFLPGIIMGGALGRLYTIVLQKWFNFHDLEQI